MWISSRGPAIGTVRADATSRNLDVGDPRVGTWANGLADGVKVALTLIVGGQTDRMCAKCVPNARAQVPPSRELVGHDRSDRRARLPV